MEAGSCAEVMDVVRTRAPALDTLCHAPLCETACQQFAQCTRQQCERYADLDTDEIANDCTGWCDEEAATNILQVSCDALISALDTDPGFAASCHGSAGCAEMADCTAYAEKTRNCMLEHCDGHADAYSAGIQQLLFDYCSTAPDCPSPETIALFNDNAVTCDDPPLDAVGPAAPFTAICAGTVNASYEQLSGVCTTLIDCGGPFTSAGQCATLLASDADPLTKATCIESAADCTEAFACL
jgi:hypothetical protein